jgi:hypothetical protein
MPFSTRHYCFEIFVVEQFVVEGVVAASDPRLHRDIFKGIK